MGTAGGERLHGLSAGGPALPAIGERGVRPAPRQPRAGFRAGRRLVFADAAVFDVANATWSVTPAEAAPPAA
jgi:hypothetical protein